ncbi:MAG: RHS repeat-associated core domain-containing protein, partial [Gemmatales bacterium]|nr:RHS repeat-associated core domain-containing protein [Gemmatales bacterium]
MTTNYLLDLNTGLTQVLANGTNTYLYGPSTGSGGRIGELQPGGWAYHLGDALGSVRQLADAGGAVTLARSYEPYGSVLSSAGGAATMYGFTGEAQSGGLVYLRARYYAPGTGRFFTKDAWEGDNWRPSTYNRWIYASDNPINRSDPSGFCDSASLAPGLYEVLGCRDRGGTYQLRVSLTSMPWSKYAADRVDSQMTVPVRHPLNLYNDNCRVTTQAEAVSYYLQRGKFHTWEIN